MKISVCNDCGEPLVQDEHGSWFDPSGSDDCDNEHEGGAGTHRAFQYAEPTTDTIPDDLSAMWSYLLEFEGADYRNQCADNGVEESEGHICRAAERSMHFRVLLHYAADTLITLQKLTQEAGHAIRFDTASPLSVVHAEATMLLAAIAAETQRCAEADAGSAEPESCGAAE